MTQHTEIELKFQVPAAARARLVAELARGASKPLQLELLARYLDTADRRLARAGLAWRLRREGGVWVQTLKAAGQHALARFEHELTRPDDQPDAHAHQGTAAGKQLLALLQQAQAEGQTLEVRYQTEVRRTERHLRTRGAVVAVAFDEGRILAGTHSLRLCEVEFELLSGSTAALLALAERWRQRFDLVYDPRSKAERGDQLAQGTPYPAPRLAQRPAYARKASAALAFGTVLDDCLAQISHNGVGLLWGDPGQRVVHVHQLRVGIRRLRCALQSFAGWVPALPNPLVATLRALFATLGQARDHDVLAGGVAAELAAAGAPALHQVPPPAPPDVAAALAHSAYQQALLACLAWRVGLTDDALADTPATLSAAARRAAPAPSANPAPLSLPVPLPQRAEKRLRKWHAAIVAHLDGFDQLDEAALHALRKRVKRQRYALEFFAPLLKGRQVKRYGRALARLQDQMGQLNDLFVARARYQTLLAQDQGAWFALGWLAARLPSVQADVRPALARLAKTAPPGA